MRRLGLIMLAVALGGCGAEGAGHGPPPSVAGTNGPFHAQASPSRLQAGGTVHLTLTVTGPIQYEAACVETLHIWAEDGQHQQVWSEMDQPIQCMAIAYRTLAAGQTATFTADWPTSRQLPRRLRPARAVPDGAAARGRGPRAREFAPAADTDFQVAKLAAGPV